MSQSMKARSPEGGVWEGGSVGEYAGEVDGGGREGGEDDVQYCEVLVHTCEQPVKGQREEDQDEGEGEIADDAEAEEPLVGGDVACGRGCVPVHEQFSGDVHQAQRADEAKEEVPEAGDFAWVAGGAHVPSLVRSLALNAGLSDGRRPQEVPPAA